ncbi:MAG: ABC transporter ATP-binding protein [Cyanobium sp. M30B3]|jgi:capsular polysaccharide transport system ATP-binding protein|nr:MAG: ABC transporter ATP-binding protein [Cyanobium sp. M30B3]
MNTVAAPMAQRLPPQQPAPILALHDASKDVVEGANQSYPAFRNLSLQIFPGERLAVFAVNGPESRALVACLSGVESLDSGVLVQEGSVSWPLGTNEAFSNKLSGYVNARFAAEVYSLPGEIDANLRLIRELSGLTDKLFHQPLSDLPAAMKDALKLAVSMVFDFDVLAVSRLKGWDHRSIDPQAVRIRECFERRIDGRTLVMSANGQNTLALDYCDEGLALVNGKLVYRGDPEVCLHLVKEESKRLKAERRESLRRRLATIIAARDDSSDDEEDDDLDSRSLGAVKG